MGFAEMFAETKGKHDWARDPGVAVVLFSSRAAGKEASPVVCAVRFSYRQLLCLVGILCEPCQEMQGPVGMRGMEKGRPVESVGRAAGSTPHGRRTQSVGTLEICPLIPSTSPYLPHLARSLSSWI